MMYKESNQFSKVVLFVFFLRFFLSSCLPLFDRPNGSGGSSSSSSGSTSDALRSLAPLDVRALSFVTCILAGLPYEVQEEPLYVVDYVNRQVR